MSSRRPALVVSAVAILGMLAVTGWAWGHISASTQIPIHFNARGAPNTYVNKQVGLLLIPAFALAVSAFFFLMPAIDPRGTNLPCSREAYNASWLAAVGLLTVIHMVTVLNAVGRHTDRRNLIGAAVGVALVIMGNYMGKLRSNFFIGFRNPWTLSSDLSWNRTHPVGRATSGSRGDLYRCSSGVRRRPNRPDRVCCTGGGGHDDLLLHRVARRPRPANYQRPVG